MDVFKKLWWFTLLRGIIFLFLAFYVFRHPVNTLIGITIYVGASLLLTGMILTFVSFASRASHPNWGWKLAGGLIDIVFGFVLLSNPALTAATLPFVVGFWIIVSGIIWFVEAFQGKKEEIPNWWLSLVAGTLSVIIGYAIMNNMLVGAIAITIWIGVGFTIAGIMNILVGFKLKSI